MVAYRHQLDNVISPKWGSCRLTDVKPIAVEKWLNEMHVAPGTKAKTKGVMSILFQHAMRYEWATTNPIRLVRQGAMPQKEEIVLTPVEVSDWVFVSPQAIGKKPYWPDAVLKRHILPAAERAGITKRIGWHSFRRTLATLLQSSGASVKTTQELMRHSSPGITLGIYAKAVTADKRQAQNAIAALFMGDPVDGKEAKM